MDEWTDRQAPPTPSLLPTAPPTHPSLPPVPFSPPRGSRGGGASDTRPRHRRWRPSPAVVPPHSPPQPRSVVVTTGIVAAVVAVIVAGVGLEVVAGRSTGRRAQEPEEPRRRRRGAPRPARPVWPSPSLVSVAAAVAVAVAVWTTRPCRRTGRRQSPWRWRLLFGRLGGGGGAPSRGLARPDSASAPRPGRGAATTYDPEAPLPAPRPRLRPYCHGRRRRGDEKGRGVLPPVTDRSSARARAPSSESGTPSNGSPGDRLRRPRRHHRRGPRRPTPSIPPAGRGRATTRGAPTNWEATARRCRPTLSVTTNLSMSSLSSRCPCSTSATSWTIPFPHES